MNFNGKVALITGASAGIGRATAIKFAKCGAKVIIVDINEEKLESVKNEILPYTDEVLSIVCNVGDEIRVKILSVDTEAKRISLSIREALTDESFEADTTDLAEESFDL